MLRVQLEATELHMPEAAAQHGCPLLDTLRAKRPHVVYAQALVPDCILQLLHQHFGSSADPHVIEQSEATSAADEDASVYNWPAPSERAVHEGEDNEGEGNNIGASDTVQLASAKHFKFPHVRTPL